LKVADDGATHCIKLLSWTSSIIEVLLKACNFGSWFYFHLKVKGGQEPNLLEPLVKLVSNLDYEFKMNHHRNLLNVTFWKNIGVAVAQAA
jgi:hypothetical protein